jgi:hypothetical protein
MHVIYNSSVCKMKRIIWGKSEIMGGSRVRYSPTSSNHLTTLYQLEWVINNSTDRCTEVIQALFMHYTAGKSVGRSEELMCSARFQSLTQGLCSLDKSVKYQY